MTKKEEKKLVLVDLDGVLANFHETLLDDYNKQYGTLHKVEEWSKFLGEHQYGEEVWADMENIYNQPGFFFKLDVIPGARETISQLLEIVDVEICTSPTKRTDSRGVKGINPHCVHDKVLWVQKHFPELSKKITLTSKKDIMKADMLIDDAVYNTHPWAANNKNGIAYLIERPWNKTSKIYGNITRGNIQNVPNFIRDNI